MSKKNLLNEAAIRRFMKLADTQSLSDKFLTEMDMGPAYQEDEDEAAPEEMPVEDELEVELPGDEGPEEEAAPEEAPEDEMPEDEMPEEEEDMKPEADEVEISEEDRKLLADAMAVLQKIVGAEAPEMMDDEDDMMEEGAYSMEEEDMMEEAVHEGEMEEGYMEEDEMLDEVELVDEDNLVQEVTSRVAARLRAAIKSSK